MITEHCGWRAGLRPTRSLLAPGLALFALAAPIDAGELVELQVYENGGEYHINVEMVVDAPARYVHAVLTDYVHVYRLNPSITESEILPSPDDGCVRVRTLVEDCLAFFCMDLVSVVDLRELPSGDLQVVIVPELSNFRSGSGEWRIRPEPGCCRVYYEARMEPDFFVPPWIGSHIMINKLRNQIIKTFDRLECMARVRAGREDNFLLHHTGSRFRYDCADDG